MKQSKDTDQPTATPGKIWKTSITKEELATLPAAPYNGKITVVETLEDADRAACVLGSEQTLGFDTETRPSFKRGEQHSVALLQLSTHTECFLIRLNKIGLPASISEILENEHIAKIGVSIHDDFLNLHKKFKLEPKGFVELQTYVKEFNIADNSLSRIYGILFGHRISKGQRLTNWEAPQLTQYQQEYAALDALACLHIYDHLNIIGFDYRTSPYYREFDDPTQQQTPKAE